MPIKKKAVVEDTEPVEETPVAETPATELEEVEVVDDSFKAGASGKFDDEVTPASTIEPEEEKEIIPETHDEAHHEHSHEHPHEHESVDDFIFAPPKSKSGSRKLIWIILVVLILAAGIGGGMYLFKSGMIGAPVATPTPEPTMEATPTPTPMPDLDRSKVNIQIQNGGGVAGAAGEAKELLEGLGYVIGDATNAKNYDHTQTEIMLKEEFMDYKDQLISDLSTKYSVSSNVTTLDEDSKYDAVVIIGSEMTDDSDDAEDAEQEE